uniref:(California timema) hypothetical protein n=1 Tax=Timema californicum TaxID=61474 RepID=A0A7R9J8L1_TIMCA|nr:unnamed protein product [Timema californicum]
MIAYKMKCKRLRAYLDLCCTECVRACYAGCRAVSGARGDEIRRGGRQSETDAEPVPGPHTLISPGANLVKDSGGKNSPPVHPTEIRTSISPSSAVKLITTSAATSRYRRCRGSEARQRRVPESHYLPAIYPGSNTARQKITVTDLPLQELTTNSMATIHHTRTPTVVQAVQVNKLANTIK